MFQVIVFGSFTFAILIAALFLFMGAFGGENQGPVGTWTIASVNAKFIQHPEIRVYRIKMNFDDGELTLRGSVNNERVRQEAEELAREVPTVEHVTNNIKVDPRSIIDDILLKTEAEDSEEIVSEDPYEIITERPHEIISEDSRALDDAIRADVNRIRAEKGDPTNEKVQIEVQGGIITISGEVRSSLDILHARILAEQIPGVREVRMELEVVNHE